MLNKIKKILKEILYHSRILYIYNAFRNRNVLSVVMFHRVLSEQDPRWLTADPEWSVTTRFFDQCLSFFKKNYNVISMRVLDECFNEGKKLPPRSLLITFDDGWSDNYQYAYDILKSHQVPSVVFVVSDIVGKTHSFWQDELFSLWRAELITGDVANELWKKSELPGCSMNLDWSLEESIRKFISELNKNDLSHIGKIQNDIKRLCAGLPGTALMLTQSELKELSLADIEIGSHGKTHNPLTRVADPFGELTTSRLELTRLLNADGGLEIKTISFPHSKANQNIVDLAFKAGYKYLFTGGDCVNKLADRHCVFGRFNIHQGRVSKRDGSLSAADMAIYMFRKPHKLVLW